MAVYNYDVVVLGSGPAGEGAAMNAAKAGRKVAMVDSRRQVGGNCTHLGTIPSKALRHSVRQILQFNTNPMFRQIGEPFWSPYESGQAEALLDYTRQKGADKQVEKRILEQLRNSTKSAKFMPQDEKSDLYRAWVAPESFHWGSVLARTGYGKIAQDAVIHGSGVPKKQLRQRSLDMLHSMHGVNPVGIVYLTTMGGYGAEVSATRIWHDWFMPGTPLAANPVPGLVVGGPNHSYTGDIEWLKKQPDAKCYADFNEPWPSNSWELTEPAIYYQAMYVRLLANFPPLRRRVNAATIFRHLSRG